MYLFSGQHQQNQMEAVEPPPPDSAPVVSETSRIISNNAELYQWFDLTWFNMVLHGLAWFNINSPSFYPTFAQHQRVQQPIPKDAVCSFAASARKLATRFSATRMHLRNLNHQE